MSFDDYTPKIIEKVILVHEWNLKRSSTNLVKEIIAQFRYSKFPENKAKHLKRIRRYKPIKIKSIFWLTNTNIKLEVKVKQNYYR